MNRLWDYRLGEPPYSFESPTYRGTIKRRVIPGAYKRRHPTIIRTARRDEAVVTAAKALPRPVIKREEGQSSAAAFAAGGDMLAVIAGTPDTLAQHVQGLVDVGLNHLLIRFLGDWSGETRYISEKSMRLFASEVLPRFKDIAPLSNPAVPVAR